VHAVPLATAAETAQASGAPAPGVTCASARSLERDGIRRGRWNHDTAETEAAGGVAYFGFLFIRLCPDPRRTDVILRSHCCPPVLQRRGLGATLLEGRTAQRTSLVA
jgi:hypothetical protein